MTKNAKSQTEFDRLVKKWKDLDRTTSVAQKAALDFYDEEIFPFVKDVFINNPQNCPKRKYDGLILTVGMSPEPLILSILAMKPEQVGFLYTDETAKSLSRIQKETGLATDQIQNRKIDGSDVVEIYETIMSLYDKVWKRPSNIAVDITGGKKSMVSGATMAGAVLGADIYYVDNLLFNRELGKPEPGSERLSSLDNPYTVFGDLEVEKAKDLYGRHDYSGAQGVFDQLEHRVPDPNTAKIYEAYKHLCATYEAWDNLNFSEATGELKELLSILGRFRSVAGLVRLVAFEQTFVQQQAALKCLTSFAKKPQEALTDPEGFHFAFMLYQNALRREAQGKLDMACLLLYRLLEWIEQHRLAQYGIDTSKPDYSKSRQDPCTLFTRYGERRKEIYKRMDRSELPDPIALIDGFIILGALEDKIVDGLNWRAFRGQVEMRNGSVYAHGMSIITDRNFDRFKLTVEERFKKAQCLAGIDVDAFQFQHKFITDPFV